MWSKTFNNSGIQYTHDQTLDLLCQHWLILKSESVFGQETHKQSSILCLAISLGVGVGRGDWEREQKGLCLYWQDQQLAGPSGKGQLTSNAVRSPPWPTGPACLWHPSQSAQPVSQHASTSISGGKQEETLCRTRFIWWGPSCRWLAG